MKKSIEYAIITIATIACSFVAFFVASGLDPKELYRNIIYRKISMIELSGNYEEIFFKSEKIQIKGDVGGQGSRIFLREIYSDPINPRRREPVVVDIVYEKMDKNMILKMSNDLKSCRENFLQIKRGPLYGVFFGKITGNYNIDGFNTPYMTIYDFDICLTKEEYYKK